MPLAEASIARIIKDADIPRGSFYQYFEDKDDLFTQIAAEEIKEKFASFTNKVIQKEGDLLSAVEEFFEDYIQHLTAEENKKLERNIFLSMNEKMKNKMIPTHKEHPCMEGFKTVMEAIDRAKLGLASEKEFKYLGKMINGMLFRLLTQFLNDITSKEECLEIFRFEMDIIKRGLKSKQTN